VQFDNGANLNLPDLASATSTITVAGAAPFVGKVAVALHITHPSAGDLILRLRSPSGTTVRLASNLGGTTDNYGGGCGNQANRTTFDDAAATRIAAGTAPFIGSFTPAEPLAAFLGEDPNGDWQLLIADTIAGDAGELRCWSLQLSPPECTAGGGACQSCVPSLTGRFTADMPSTTTRLVRDGVPSGCGSPKACPAVATAARLFYRVHLITNTGPETCVTAVLADFCRASNLRLHAAAYLGSYDPANPCANYLGDTGSESTAASANFSFTAPQDAVIALVVSSPVSAPSCVALSYLLQLHGLPCPPPTLHIEKTGSPDEVRLHWSTAYPDFDLQRTPILNGAAPYPFENVATPPVVVNGDYSVTNRVIAPQSFYRLRKP
jgi:subtilisin-like proprotein convertase family protein